MPVFEKNCPNSNQIRAARWLLGWGQNEAVKCTNTSLSSLRRYEGLKPDQNPYDHLRPSIIERIVDGFKNAGIEFLNSEDSLGVTLRASSELSKKS